MKRELGHATDNPMPGDVVELREEGTDDCEIMLRVLAVVEDFVGFKEYGKGRFWVHKKVWKERIKKAAVAKLFRGGDHDMPF